VYSLHLSSKVYSGHAFIIIATATLRLFILPIVDSMYRWWDSRWNLLIVQVHVALILRRLCRAFTRTESRRTRFLSLLRLSSWSQASGGCGHDPTVAAGDKVIVSTEHIETDPASVSHFHRDRGVERLLELVIELLFRLGLMVEGARF